MNIHIPTRDGSYLNATVYRPVGVTAPVAAVFMITPYAGDASHPSGSYFARNGIAYINIDARGRGDSPGAFKPFDHDGEDGYDVVEWLAKQPWSDGHVGMFGGSYAGAVQWLVAALRPPHLTTILPVASARAGVDFPAPNNIFQQYDIQWLTYVTGHPLYTNVFADDALWDGLNKRLYETGRPFSQLDIEAGNPSPTFQTWVKHPAVDDYWRRLSPSKSAVAAITLPLLLITGTHDDAQRGVFSYLMDRSSAADGPLPPENYIVIGPWDHSGTREPKSVVGDEHFGEASLIDMMRLQLEWYRHAMLGTARPAFLKKPVTYYVSGSGAECWRYADTLGAATARRQTLYFNAANGGGNLRKAGILQDRLSGSKGGEWISDPSDLRNASPSKAAPGDDLRGDGLVFNSTPFDKDVEIAGQVKINLALAIDGPDADIGYRLYLVTPDGNARLLSDAAVRARYRKSLEKEEFVTPGAIESYDLTPGRWFAMRASKGSLLRVVLRSVNSPDLQKNWNARKPVAEQTAEDAHRESIRLVQTAQHPSTISIPFGEIASQCTASADW
jgi:uncharacterized protein